MVMQIEGGWFDKLKMEIHKPYIRDLQLFLEEEKRGGYIIYPLDSLVFHAFRQTSFEATQVVIVGQDPYHGEGQAHGLSFSVPKEVAIPPSLKNIYKELERDLGIPPASHGCLEKWASQGVLLLNATLTVRAQTPKSHYGQGWERFTDYVIALLSKRDDPLVFILWGKSAQEKCQHILREGNHSHLILKAAHPSPYSADRFFGSRPFSQTNEQLKKWGKTPIDWRLDT